MANRLRGEVDAEFDGKTYTLCLTLGALAELENALGGDLMALVSRFESGAIRSADLVAIIGAGLRGGGTAIGNDAVARLKTAGGASGFINIAAELLKAAFLPGEPPGNPPALQDQPIPGGASLQQASGD